MHPIRTSFRRTFALAGVVAIIAAACGGDDDSADGAGTLPAPAPTLDGTTVPAAPAAADPPAGAWRAVGGTVDGVEVELIAGAEITLVVDGGEVNGVAACNQYGTRADFGADGSLLLSEGFITEMGCVDDGVMQLEQTFAQSLWELDAWSLDGDRLVLSNATSSWTFERAGSADSVAPEVAEELSGRWSAVEGEVGGSDVDLSAGELTIEFDVERGQASGLAACNGYGAEVEIGDGQLSVTELTQNLMGCEGDVADLERAYLTSLGAVDTWERSGERLVLSSANDRWVFERATPSPSRELANTSWVLDTFISGPTASNSDAMEFATLWFDRDGSLSGSTGCRPLAGAWVDDGRELTLTAFEVLDDPAAGDCAPEALEVEEWVVAVLSQQLAYERDGDRLTLMNGDGDGLSYRSTTDVPATTMPPLGLDPAAGSTVEVRAVLACEDEPGQVEADVVLRDLTSGVDCSLGAPVFEGPVFAADAIAAPDVTGNWAVTVNVAGGSETDWNAAAATCFERSEECPTGRLAIVADGVIVSAPTVMTPEFPSQIQISGAFTQADAEAIAAAINGTG